MNTQEKTVQAVGALTGLEKWDWTAPDRVPEELLQIQVLGADGFADAQVRAIDNALDFVIHNQSFQSMICDLGTFFLCMMALYMDASGGLTHRRLRELTGETGVISAGRASAALWRLRRLRFIEPADDQSRRFVPTPFILDSMRKRTLAELRALPALDPAVQPLVDRMHEPEVFKIFIRHMGESALGGALNPDPRLDDFSKVGQRNSGVLVMYALAANARGRGAQRFTGEVDIPIAVLARQFGISRSHVHGLLKLMEEAGMMETMGSRRFLMPSFGLTLGMFQGLVFAGELRIAHRVLRELNQA